MRNEEGGGGGGRKENSPPLSIFPAPASTLAQQLNSIRTLAAQALE